MGRQNKKKIGLVTETEEFLKFLDDQKFPDVCPRDDLKKFYDKDFATVRAKKIPNYQSLKVSFQSIIQELKRCTMLFELGDYYSFGDVQDLFKNLNENLSDDMKKKREEWKAIAQENPAFCPTCGIDCQSEKSFRNHKNGHRHRIHKLHEDMDVNRGMLDSSKDGVLVTSDPSVVNGMIEKACPSGEKTTLSITIKNERKEGNLVMVRHILLWNTGVFTVGDYRGRAVRPKHHMQPGDEYLLQVSCNAPEDYGHHFVPLAFYFQWKENQEKLVLEEDKQFFILRFVSVHALGDLHEDLAPTAPFEYPDMLPDVKVTEIVAGKPLPDSSNNDLSAGNKLKPVRIPVLLPYQVKKGLTGEKQIISPQLRSILDVTVDSGNYKKKMDYLLWTEELQMMEDIKRYDLIGVTMEFDRRAGLMILEVPGLAERRPSVLRGDRVFVYIDQNRGTQYEAFVHRVEELNVHLGVSARLESQWIKGRLFDIRFDFSRWNLWVEHRAVGDSNYANTILFPTSDTRFGARDSPVVMKPWYDSSLNEEQCTAVKHIVQGTSRPAPYLIFGPPGTGKTVTVTEAIRQVYHCVPSARILVCCPENTAADLVMKKLISTNLRGTIQKKDIFRMYAVSRASNTIPLDIRNSGMYNKRQYTDDLYYPAQTELKKYKILVMTLMSSGRLVSGSFPRNFFTHVFIDEGAQAIEPECIIPLTGLMDARQPTCGQLVIAGDPKQLGPILRSSFSLNYGLDVSLMQRLMTNVDEYQRPSSGSYDNQYITKLVRNYRSHEAILTVPRKLFYDNELERCGDEMILNSMLNWEGLPNKKFPIIFHSVFGDDEREAQSPSWFNRDEIAQVEKYLQILLKEKKSGQKLKAKDIGIISPYRRQVMKLRQMIRSKNYGNRDEIAVGSVEEFQGQEFKVIIISTVRSKTDKFISLDMQFHLGFLKNPKRFNVAITRARALLIVIGNPLMLEQDDNWKCFLDHCDTNGGFKGQRGKRGPSPSTPGGTTSQLEQKELNLSGTVDQSEEIVYKRTGLRGKEGPEGSITSQLEQSLRELNLSGSVRKEVDQSEEVLYQRTGQSLVQQVEDPGWEIVE